MVCVLTKIYHWCIGGAVSYITIKYSDLVEYENTIFFRFRGYVNTDYSLLT